MTKEELDRKYGISEYPDGPKYGTWEMFWRYLKWKKVNNPGPDDPPWPYYDPDCQEYGNGTGPYPSLDELEDVKAWLDDMVNRLYGTMAMSDAKGKSPLTNTGRARQKVKALLDTPDPWEGIIDDGIDSDAYDYDSSYPSREDVIEAVNEWLSKNGLLLI